LPVTLFRRLWWWTLPYYGWTGYSGEEGATPPPWYAFPISWLHRLNDFAFFRARDVFGPRYARDCLTVGAPRWKPWQ
jgi:hypothetical protein